MEIKNIYFKYNNSEDYILKNLNLNFEKEKITCILGESGSGKSTILRLISGLETPEKGSIRINDEIMVNNSTFLPPEKREVGVVFQDYALFPHMKVSQNILFGINNKNKKQRKTKLKEMLNLIELNEHKNKYPHQLSGGQQQRVALARALAVEPALIVLDEPFSNLDANLKSNIRNQLKKINKKTGITTIFVSHDINDAVSIGDKITVIKEGKIVQQGKPDSIINNPASSYVSGLIQEKY